MKFLPLLACAAFGILATQAQAADTPPWSSQSYQPPTWQGFFFGINAGVAWGHDDITQSSTTTGAQTGFSPSMDTEGGAVGFHAGYNYLMNPVLIGADGDWDYSGSNGGYRIVANGDGQDEKFEWLSTVRARIGLPMGNLLPFVTGGVAFSDIKDSYHAGVTQEFSNTRTGWVLGGGLEYALPENITARIDYRYYDFGSYSETPSGVFPGSRYKQEPTMNEVTAGISYNFW